MHANRWEYLVAATPHEYIVFHLQSKDTLRVGAAVPAWRGSTTVHTALPLIGIMVALMLIGDHVGEASEPPQFVPCDQWQAARGTYNPGTDVAPGGGPADLSSKEGTGHGSAYPSGAGAATNITSVSDILRRSVSLPP